MQAAPYHDGIRLLSDGGAFVVDLHHIERDVHLGDNTFVVRIAMPDTQDLEAPGWGIPDAELDLVAWMPETSADDALSPPATAELGNGIYEVSRVHFDRHGVWQLDLHIRVGNSMDEMVSYVFLLDEAVS